MLKTGPWSSMRTTSVLLPPSYLSRPLFSFDCLSVFKISYEYYGLYNFCSSFFPLQLPPVLQSLSFIVFSLQLLLLQIHKQIEKQMTCDRQTDSQIDTTEASIALRYKYRSDHLLLDNPSGIFSPKKTDSPSFNRH